MDLGSRLLFRINSHGKTENVPHFIDLLYVFGISDPGDGMQLRIDAVGSGAAQQIDLVGTGGGDQQIRVPDAGLEQHVHGGAVAVDRHNIKALDAGVKHLAVGIDQGDVVALGRKLPGKGGADLTVTGNNNIHSVLQSYGRIPS